MVIYMKQDNYKYLNWFLILLVVIFSLIIIYMLILKISGHSPTDIVILYSFVGLVVTNLFIVYGMLVNFNYKFGRMEGKLDSLAGQFSSLAQDFKEHVKHRK